jgi:hypothetical protein
LGEILGHLFDVILDAHIIIVQSPANNNNDNGSGKKCDASGSDDSSEGED